MRSRLCLLMVTLMVLLSFSAACSWIGLGSRASVDMMKKLPVNSTSFSYWAVGKVNADEDLWDIYAIFRQSQEADQVKDVGLALSSIEHSVRATGFTAPLRLLGGALETADVERLLEGEDYANSTYQETTIWTPSEGQDYQSVAARDNVLLFGDAGSLHVCLDVIVESQESSLYDDPNTKSVIDKLPEGIIVQVDKAGEAAGEEYDDLVCYGKAYEKADEGRLSLTAVYMFQDNYTAGQAQGDISSYLEGEGYTEVKLEREDSFIRATARIRVSDFAGTLQF